MSTDRAISDLREKLKLEVKFSRKLRTLNNRIVRDFKEKYSENGEVVNALLYKEDFEELLFDRYGETGKTFSSRISLPVDVAMTDDEESEINTALNLFYLTRVGEQATLITETNQKDLLSSLETGIIESQEQEEGFSRVDAAAFGAIALVRKLRGREGAISVTETQVIAEAAKITEAEVLIGVVPNISMPNKIVVNVEKEWFTVGDERVRPSHMISDGQVVDMNEPFVVGGELLNYPSDSSLGASAGNTINCRCTSVVNEEQIIAKRREAISFPEAFATVN